MNYNPAFSGINPAKTFERFGKYKNGIGTFHVNIKSETPKSYNMDVISFDNDGRIATAYTDAFVKESKPNEFDVYSKLAINKIKAACEDSKLVDDITNFFKSISK